MELKSLCKELNIEYYGITNTETGSAIVCLFPYFNNFEKGNISRYAAIPDYHMVCKQYLEKIAALFDCKSHIYADVSPYNEVELAQRAGLGIIGRNGLLINEKYGSFVFIGLVVLEGMNIKPSTPLTGKCIECDKCISSCPGKAISEKGINTEKCLSHITQKKGELSAFETELILNNDTVWGCDICSDVCPHNKNVPETPIAQFRENIMASISEEDLENLSEREFKKKFFDRAFTWRGKKTLLRNLKIKNKTL